MEYRSQKKYADAESLYQEAIPLIESTRESSIPSDPGIGRFYGGYADLVLAQKEYNRADVLFKQSLSDLDKTAPVHRLPVLESYASMLKERGQITQFEEIENQINDLRTTQSQ